MKLLTYNELFTEICTIFNVTEKEILKKTRKEEVKLVRQYYAYIGMKYYRFPCTSIAKRLNQDHTTCLSSRNRIQKFIDCNDMFTLTKMIEIKNNLNLQDDELLNIEELKQKLIELRELEIKYDNLWHDYIEEKKYNKHLKNKIEEANERRKQYLEAIN